MQFWEAAFYNDVQIGIKGVYLAMQDQVIIFVYRSPQFFIEK